MYFPEREIEFKSHKGNGYYKKAPLGGAISKAITLLLAGCSPAEPTSSSGYNTKLININKFALKLALQHRRVSEG